MEKFSKTLHGYNPIEVNEFLDNVINNVEKIVSESKRKDREISELKPLEKENADLKNKIAQYERMEATLSRAIIMAEKTSEQMKVAAHNEAETILTDAKGHANRIVNDALIKAEKSEQEANMLRRNINIFKRRIKDIIAAQLEVVDEMDDIEL